MVSESRRFRFIATLLIVAVTATGCAIASEERGGPGASGNPVVVVGQCAEDAPDCNDTAVDNTPGTTTQAETTIDVTSSTTVTPTTHATDLQLVEVAFTTHGGQCDDVTTFERQIDSSLDWIAGAFESLLAGPTEPEMAAGAASFLSIETMGMMQSAAVEDGLLVVDMGDLRSVIPNASTACGSMALLAQFNTTAFQFSSVDRLRYEIQGNCDTFANWLQRECAGYTKD